MKFSLASWTPQTWLIAFITVCAAVLRLWNLPGTLMFQGDQGRDALIVSQIFTQGDLVFIGPVTSVGNMYLGPLYYYFMVPWLWLSYPSPLGPAYAVAVLGILTVPLMYFLGSKLVGRRAAMISAFLMAFSVVAVTLSRFSWNPNPAPIVSLIMIFATYMAWQKNKWYWLAVALCFSVLIQLHYLTLLTLGGAGLIWLFQVWDIVRIKKKALRIAEIKMMAMTTFLSLIIFAVSLVPLALFDYKHDYLNARAFQSLFSQEEILIDSKQQTSVVEKVADIVKDTRGRAMHILFEPTFGQHQNFNAILLLGLVLILVAVMRRPSIHGAGYVTVLAYLVTSIVGVAAYQHTIFDHYILFVLPAAFLAVGMALAWLSRRKFGSIPAVIGLGAFLVLNLQKLPIQTTTSTIYDLEEVAHSIETKLKPNEPYSLVLLAPSRDLYAQNYRYYLSTGPSPALPPERSQEAETLVVIDEEQNSSVPDLPIYEIVTFPEKRPSEVYTIPDGPRIWIFRKPLST